MQSSTLDRRHFIVALGATTAAAFLPGIDAQAADAPAPRPVPAGMPLPDAATLHFHGDDAAVVTWGFKHRVCTGCVEYGETEKLGKVAKIGRFGMSQFDEEVLAVPLRNLIPGKTVFYRTLTVPLEFGPGVYMHKIKRGEAIASPVRSFAVPAKDADTLKIGMWNDTHMQEKTVDALRAATAKFAPDCVVLNGDINDFNQAEALSNACLRPTGGGIAMPDWPMVYARGNHDLRGFFARNLPKYMPPQAHDGYYGLLRLGPVAMLVLDTGEDGKEREDYGRMTECQDYRIMQQAWLEKAVEDPRFTSAPFRLLFCHIPLRWGNMGATGEYSPWSAELWTPALAKGRVQAVFSGHTHAFWHSQPTAAQPFHQIVGGGPETRSTGWSPTPATLTEITATRQALRISVAEAVSGKEHLTLALNPLA